ncbi:MAG: hypothetical protein NC541_13645 [bacterium]|nr:hypothetical protein [bacterium]
MNRRLRLVCIAAGDRMENAQEEDTSSGFSAIFQDKRKPVSSVAVGKIEGLKKEKERGLC